MSIYEYIIKYFKNTPREELKHLNEIGPICEEYFARLKEAGLYPKKNVKDKFVSKYIDEC